MQTQLQYTELRAPFSGRITRKLAEVGDLASPAGPVYELRSVLRPELIIQVPSLHVGSIQPQMEAEVTFTNFPGTVVKGEVSEISPVNDDRNRNFQVKLRLLDSPFERDLDGVIGMATFKFGSKKEAFWVPVSAIIKPGGGDNFSVVYVDNNKAQMFGVEVLAVDGERAVLHGELPEGKQIVISGQEYVKPGQEVRVVETFDAQKLVDPNNVVITTDQRL